MLTLPLQPHRPDRHTGRNTQHPSTGATPGSCTFVAAAVFTASRRTAAAAATAPTRAGAVSLVADLDRAAATAEARRGGAGEAEAGRTLCIGLRRLSIVDACESLEVCAAVFWCSGEMNDSYSVQHRLM